MSTRRRHSRRAALAALLSVPVAGCSGSLGNETLLDRTLEDSHPASIEANEGDELEVTVTVETVYVDDGLVQLQIAGTGSTPFGPLIVENIADEETITETVDADGTYSVIVGGGDAHVKIVRR